MHDSNRGIITTARLGLFAAVSLTVSALCGIFYSQGYASGQDYQRAKVERQHYAAETPKRIEQECRQPVPAAYQECVTEIIDAQRESERGESDLAAQWKAADWVFWAAIFAGAQGLITLVGTALLYEQIKLTREAVEDTGRATEAMENDQRPWLTSEIEIEFVSSSGDGWTVALRIKIKNIGRSPALDVRWDCALYDDLGRSQQWIDAMLSNIEGWHPERRPYHSTVAIMPGETFTDQEIVCVDSQQIPTLALGPSMARLFFTTDYDISTGRTGRTITAFYFGPKQAHKDWPGAFDIEQVKRQTDIMIRRVGTVLST